MRALTGEHPESFHSCLRFAGGATMPNCDPPISRRCVSATRSRTDAGALAQSASDRCWAGRRMTELAADLVVRRTQRPDSSRWASST